MPIYECICNNCNIKREVLTLRCSEELPKCECGGELKVIPSKFTFRWAYREGVWEEENGKQVFKGKGGPQRIIGGERLKVHDGFPEMADPTPDIYTNQDKENEEIDDFPEITEDTITNV